jgi:hypothetical protein
MRQFPNGAQERQRHFARTVVLQLLFVPVAAIDHFEQEVIRGLVRWPASALGSCEHAWQVVADLP